MVEAVQGRQRKAPYAPISALHDFFGRIRNMSVPAIVDRKFIQKLNIASNNEWALLSALKFIGVIDDRGEPTSAYRLLQTTDRFEDTLRHLVETAYAPLIEVGGLQMSAEDLENYFRVTSSPSQAKNAARFFREITRMAGVTQQSSARTSVPQAAPEGLTEQIERRARTVPEADEDTRDIVLRAKAALVEKLPAPRPDWSAEEYAAICHSFLEMLEHLGPADL